MGNVTIDEVTIPSAVDDPAAADFVRGVEVGNEVDVLAYGTPDIAYEPAEELPGYRDVFRPRGMFVARLAGEIVGRATWEIVADDASGTAWISAGVLPACRGRGVGRVLADAIEASVLARGRTTALAYIGIQQVPGPRLESPTGFGSVPTQSRDVRFLLARGYSLEQVERVSRLVLPVPDLESRLAAALAATGVHYRVHTWVGRTPERFLDDIAVLSTRMSTDAPTAGLEEPEDIWTVARLVTEDERRERTDPRVLVTAAAEHVPTGRLVAFTQLSVPRQAHRAAMQEATLVMREHRGRRLGMLVKVANLVHLERTSPGHPSVVTFNAEENRVMLDVNETLGFGPIGYEGAFTAQLS